MKRYLVQRAAAVIRSGGLVAFPTETIYGLGANALDDAACNKIFVLKGRPADNPLIVHVSDERMLMRVANSVSPAAKKLMRTFWPGPLTLILPKRAGLAASVSRLQTVAVRMPDHPVALALIKAAGVPIAAPSANKSGSPSPTSASHVRRDFPKLLVLDDDASSQTSQHGLESTVVALDGRPRVLRLGAITLEQLRAVIPGIQLAHRPARGSAPESPGMKYRHYAPDKPLILFGPCKLAQLRRYAKSAPSPVVLCKSAYAHHFGNIRVIDLGSTDRDVARNLFSALRTTQGKTLLVLGVYRRGIGRTVMDRLERAATKRV